MIIAQISDPHLTLSGGKADARFATAEHLQKAVAHILRMPASPDVVLVTGDCIDDGSIQAYEFFRELLSPLTMPVYVIPGNHDDRVNMREVLGIGGREAMANFYQYVVDDRPVRLIALDTNIPGEGGGRLCEERLDWLEERLAEDSSRPTMILMHHPPFLTGLHVLDSLGLDGTEAFGAIVARHPNVERIVAGHVHVAMQRRFHGTLAVTCPSTAHQTLLDLQRPERLAMIMEPPACLMHLWGAEMGLVTYVNPIGDYGPETEVHDGTNWVS